jgi:hypothetical protein
MEAARQVRSGSTLSLWRALALAVLCVWELPQNVLGLAALIGCIVCGNLARLEWDGRRLVIEVHQGGVSLGLFVLWSTGRNRYFVLDADNRQHEYGHSVQSRWLGPLYLAAVGVPSVARVLYAMVYRELTGRRWQGYYDGYPERWADRLGGVRRR